MRKLHVFTLVNNPVCAAYAGGLLLKGGNLSRDNRIHAIVSQLDCQFHSRTFHCMGEFEAHIYTSTVKSYYSR